MRKSFIVCSFIFLINIHENCIHEEIKGRVNSGNSCCHLVQNVLSFGLLAENINNMISRKTVFPVLCGYKIWSLTLTEEHRLRLFENMMLRKVFGSKRDNVVQDQKRLYTEELLDLYSSPNIIQVFKS
jgi:hypothetical protein